MAKQETQKESELLKAANEEILALKEIIEKQKKELDKSKKEKPKEKVFVESEEADDIYTEICILHERSETKQQMAALRLGLIPTQLQIITSRLNICKNDIARALGK